MVRNGADWSLHAQSFSASLARLDTRTRPVPGLPATVPPSELRLLARPERSALTALWTATRFIQSTPGGSVQAQQLAGFADPFGDAAAVPALDVTSPSVSLLQSGLLADGTVLIAYVPPGAERITTQLLRSVRPTGEAREQPLPADPASGDAPQLVVNAEGNGFSSFQRLQARYVLARSSCAP
jgi:hypothetical protein